MTKNTNIGNRSEKTPMAASSHKHVSSKMVGLGVFSLCMAVFYAATLKNLLGLTWLNISIITMSAISVRIFLTGEKSLWSRLKKALLFSILAFSVFYCIAETTIHSRGAVFEEENWGISFLVFAFYLGLPLVFLSLILAIFQFSRKFWDRNTVQ